MDESGLDDEYVRKHARPGEDWEQARRRLVGVVENRFAILPSCVSCSIDAHSFDEAMESHQLVGVGRCIQVGEAWPEEALHQAKFDPAHVAQKYRTEDLAVIVRNQVHAGLVHLAAGHHAINIVTAAQKLHGYLQLAQDLGLFDRAEYVNFMGQVHQIELKARQDFILQFRANDLAALPWRLIEPRGNTEEE